MPEDSAAFLDESLLSASSGMPACGGWWPSVLHAVGKEVFSARESASLFCPHTLDVKLVCRKTVCIFLLV